MIAWETVAANQSRALSCCAPVGIRPDCIQLRIAGASKAHLLLLGALGTGASNVCRTAYMAPDALKECQLNLNYLMARSNAACFSLAHGDLASAKSTVHQLDPYGKKSANCSHSTEVMLPYINRNVLRNDRNENERVDLFEISAPIPFVITCMLWPNNPQ